MFKKALTFVGAFLCKITLLEVDITLISCINLKNHIL